MKTSKPSDYSPAHREAIEAMKNQLLIVLINRLGGIVDIPVSEIDGTGQFGLMMRLDQGLDYGTSIFHFEITKQQPPTPQTPNPGTS